MPPLESQVIEHSLMKPLDKVAGMSVLKNCGVRKVFKYSRAEPPPPHAATPMMAAASPQQFQMPQ